MNFNCSAARRFESVGSIDQKIRKLLFLRLRHLRRNPRLGFRVRKTVAQHQTFELHLGPAVDHDQFIEPSIPTRFDHQRGVDNADTLRIFAFPLAHDFVLARDDERMKNVVQLLALLVVGENKFAQVLAIQGAVLVEHFVAESFRDGFQSGRARETNFARCLVGVQRVATKARED